ncbi:MAG: glycosyltransferase, partial [Candidatus Firestonebacteria bacterium]|nr:glycosyltransferase [Candidatus Firestonebacteria bacterium]
MGLNVLLINKFFYKKGGSETALFDSAELLKKKGNKTAFFSMKHPDNFASEYSKYFVDNIDFFITQSIWSKIKIVNKILFSFEAKTKLKKLLKTEKIDIAHLHNIAHQISPSILHVLKKNNIPVVMTLHDYKLVCGSYSMLSQGEICENCKGGRYYQILNKKCKGSFVNNSIIILEMYLHHRLLNIYNNVDLFVSPSIFLIDKIKEMGFKGKFVYLPNFIEPSKYSPNYSWEQERIIYFGRLSKEKGIDTLISAVKNIEVYLDIIGDGPEKTNLEEKVKLQNIENVRFLGYKKGKELQDEIRNSMFVVIPSQWYENNPYSIIEAFALGKPVI